MTLEYAVRRDIAIRYSKTRTVEAEQAIDGQKYPESPETTKSYGRDKLSVARRAEHRHQSRYNDHESEERQTGESHIPMVHPNGKSLFHSWSLLSKAHPSGSNVTANRLASHAFQSIFAWGKQSLPKTEVTYGGRLVN